MTDSLGTAYAHAAYDQQGVLATWFPDRVLRVGDIVSRSARTGALTVQTDLPSVAETAGMPTASTSLGPQRLTFQRGATIEMGLGANAPATDAHISFAGSSSFMFAATTGSATSYDRLQPVRAAIAKLGSRGLWEPSWQLVTSVRTFENCLLLIARGSGAAARLTIAPTASGTGLDAIEVALGAAITRGDAVKWELNTCTPLYEGLVLQRTMWGPDKVDDRYLDTPGAADEVVVRAQPSDLSLP